MDIRLSTCASSPLSEKDGERSTRHKRPNAAVGRLGADRLCSLTTTTQRRQRRLQQCGESGKLAEGNNARPGPPLLLPIVLLAPPYGSVTRAHHSPPPPSSTPPTYISGPNKRHFGAGTSSRGIVPAPAFVPSPSRTAPQPPTSPHVFAKCVGVCPGRFSEGPRAAPPRTRARASLVGTYSLRPLPPPPHHIQPPTSRRAPSKRAEVRPRRLMPSVIHPERERAYAPDDDDPHSYQRYIPLHMGSPHRPTPLLGLLGSKRARPGRTFAVPARPPPAASSPRPARPSNRLSKPLTTST
ncbi:hypothetical protein FIBSPDRAFT_1026800 [Athelia psychrophila]|uniref:Uncharacterized protein n=1 Tax=Athelia psychrophila TaxID=1759441 RepID=A0A166UMU5_9AGAM|nr:hypothetical protein FIBSPDRAFT_1026800 [Fibularhizoctonia sp. CBS 109695]